MENKKERCPTQPILLLFIEGNALNNTKMEIKDSAAGLIKILLLLDLKISVQIWAQFGKNVTL